VSLDDAAFSVGRAALWVAAVAAGDLGVLRDACEDRLHQDLRLQARPDTAAVRRELLARSDVLAAWLSGSGPSVAALVPRDVASIVAASLPGGGTVRELDIAVVGVTATDSAILD
jgi:homoserine kinase